MTDSTSNRRPYTGSCHCGKTRYIAYLTLPPQSDLPEPPIDTMHLKKCNCTACHKFGFFHVRLTSSPDDFILLSPADPFKELSDYQIGSKIAHLWFCPTCGVRCFLFSGVPTGEEWAERVDIDLEKWLGKESEGKMTTVWRPKKEGWQEERTAGLRVNAISLDAGQEGLDLREWHDKGWIAYFDGFHDDKNSARKGTPYPGGLY